MVIYLFFYIIIRYCLTFDRYSNTQALLLTLWYMPQQIDFVAFDDLFDGLAVKWNIKRDIVQHKL